MCDLLVENLGSFRVAYERWMLCHWKSIDATFNYGLDGYIKTKDCIALLLFPFICSVSAADSKIEQTVRDQDAQWSKAAESRDLEKLLSFYGDDAVVLPAHAAIATTKDSIGNIFQKLLSIPGVALSWKPTKVTVAGSGDLAYSTGPYEMSAPDDTGKPSIDRGKYVAVWKKQADGRWKVAVDIWNTDLPCQRRPIKSSGGLVVARRATSFGRPRLAGRLRWHECY